MVNTCNLINDFKQYTCVETLQKPGIDIEFGFVAFSAAAEIICIFIIRLTAGIGRNFSKYF